ncbi:hypothetical protein EWF20_00285 [Sulfolobus sp. S-194]|uniref:hypothetical protein n=1 Tax=Sulfolobus sp. S-194 TaxID=2512240 RepID=UPI0014373179|nr:hypothetical protein [Sulfolobus sp. S-194]QIW22754.1 hypothetical protein EWF20_00285 [Sulfolobus sp. S-194]
MYVRRIFDSIFIITDKDKANEIEKRRVFERGYRENFQLLGEPSVDETKEVIERSNKRRFSSIQI